MKSQTWLKFGVLALTASALAGMGMRRSRRISLQGRKALITRGSRGLGFAAARRFVRAGSDVAICARDEGELERARLALGDIAQRTRRRNGRAPEVLAIAADVADTDDAKRLVSEVSAAFGRIDVLVNCAVEITIGPLDALTTADFEHAFRGIFFALYEPTMAVLPLMRARHFGRIVNVTSVAGKAPVPHSATYVAGKFATTGFSAVCAAELRKYGIRVSTVLPPPLRNGAWLNGNYKAMAEQELFWFARGLQSRLTSADPERAAQAIVRAARDGGVEYMVAPASYLQARLHALLPSLSIALAAFVERWLMPRSPLGASELPALAGEEIVSNSRDPRMRRLARSARPAAEAYLQPVARRIP